MATESITKVNVTSIEPHKMGVSYASETRRLEIIMEDEDKKKFVTNLVIKHPLTVDMHPYIRTQEFVENEHIAYKTLVPFLRNNSEFPKPFYNTYGVTTLEFFEGFHTPSVEDLTEEVLQKAAQHLAKFHVNTMYLRQNNNLQFKEVISQTKELYFDEGERNKNTIQFTMKATIVAAKLFLERIAISDTEKKYVKCLQDLDEHFDEYFAEVLKNVNVDNVDLKVVCHGDYWPRNFLVRKTGTDLEFRIIDLQGVTYSNIARDIVYFLASLVEIDDNVDNIAKRREIITNAYISQIKESWEALKIKGAHTDYTEALVKQMELLKKFELLVSLWLLPTSAEKSETHPKLSTNVMDWVKAIEDRLDMELYLKNLNNKMAFLMSGGYFPPVKNGAQAPMEH